MSFLFLFLSSRGLLLLLLSIRYICLLTIVKGAARPISHIGQKSKRTKTEKESRRKRFHISPFPAGKLFVSFTWGINISMSLKSCFKFPQQYFYVTRKINVLSMVSVLPSVFLVLERCRLTIRSGQYSDDGFISPPLLLLHLPSSPPFPVPSVQKIGSSPDFV